MKTENILLLKEYAHKYTYLREKLKDIEKEMDQLKNNIEDILIKSNTNGVQTSTMNIKRNIVKQKRISKDDLPPELFEKYSHPIVFSTINIQTVNYPNNKQLK